jgi:hypothetical protein
MSPPAETPSTALSLSVSTPISLAQLEVDRTTLRDGLRQLARHTRPARAGDAVLRFEDGSLDVQIGGGRIRAPATGRWPGEARVPGSFVLAMAKHLPNSDPIPIRVENGRLHLAGTSIGCHWQKFGAAQAVIPIGASLVQILRVGAEFRDEDLERSGILGQVNEARERRDQLIARAAEILFPLEIDDGDLANLVEEHVGRAPGHGEGET